jgi:molybdenum cofactor cytidylyltransferase
MATAASTAIPVILVGGREVRHLRVPKQILPFGDSTVLGKTLRAYLDAGVSEVIVVLGYKADQIIANLGPLPSNVRIVRNPIFEEGMATFLKAGLREMTPGARSFCVGICDQPLLTADLVREFIGAFYEGGKKLLVPVMQTSLGLPVVLDSSLIDEIQALPPRGELWDLIKRHGDDLVDHPTGYTAVIRSIEDQDDYHDMLRLAGLKIPEIPFPPAAADEPREDPNRPDESRGEPESSPSPVDE